MNLEQQLTSKMSESEKIIFYGRYNADKKKYSTAILLCFFLGSFGAHCFYLDKTVRGVFHFLFCWTLIPGLISLFELFLISDEVDDYNKTLMLRLAGK